MLGKDFESGCYRCFLDHLDCVSTLCDVEFALELLHAINYVVIWSVGLEKAPSFESELRFYILNTKERMQYEWEQKWISCYVFNLVTLSMYMFSK